MKKNVQLLNLLLLSIFITGCGHTHTWEDATCTTPKICIECSEIEGEALGHTTELGKCERCQEFQGKDIFEEIISKVSKTTEKIGNIYKRQNEALTKVTTIEAVYKNMQTTDENIRPLLDDYQVAIDMCGDCAELKDFKDAIQDIVDSYPNFPNTNDYDAVMDYAEGISSTALKIESLGVEAEELSKLY